MAYRGSEALVAAAEERLVRRLPAAHRDRLIGENGGAIQAGGDTWTLYPVWDPTDRRTIGRTANHIERENQTLRREWPEVLPEGVTAIADNGGGDLLVLVPHDDAVRFWDHETGTTTAATVFWSS